MAEIGDQHCCCESGSEIVEESSFRESAATVKASQVWLVDAHAHVYSCFDLKRMLDSAAVNFSAAAAQIEHCGPWLGCLLLADLPHQDSIACILRWSRNKGSGDWTVRRTQEPGSLICDSGKGHRIIVVAGWQLVCREGLEILALASTRPVDGWPESASFREVLSAVYRQDAIAVVPWGFGKWWLRRGRHVRRWLESMPDSTGAADMVFVGDNSGRLRHCGSPRLFKLAASRQVRLLAGSDPLPFPRHAGQPGRYGFVLRGEARLTHPAACLKSILRSSSTQPPGFGQRARIDHFCRDQIAMQRRKLGL